MQQLPTAAQLLATVADVLEREIVPALQGPTQHHARVAASIVGIVERELTLGDAAAERERVVNLSTGAWFDPDADGMCVHGNPNVLTADVGSSKLAQGSTGQHVLVEIERYDGTPPPVRAHVPPEFVARA